MHGNAYINLWLRWQIFQQQAYIPAQTIKSLRRALITLALDSHGKNGTAWQLPPVWRDGPWHLFKTQLSQNDGTADCVLHSKESCRCSWQHRPWAEHAIGSIAIWCISHALLLITHLPHSLITAASLMYHNKLVKSWPAYTRQDPTADTR